MYDLCACNDICSSRFHRRAEFKRCVTCAHVILLVAIGVTGVLSFKRCVTCALVIILVVVGVTGVLS